MKRITFKCTLCAIFTTLAIISFVIENLFPPIIFVGARIGVSNVFILLSLISLGAGYAFIALIIKTLIGSLFAGNISMIMYSLPAGAIALGTEILCFIFIKKLSVLSIGVLGAFINTVMQTLTFCIITGGFEYFYYLPYLALIAILSGLTVGITVTLIIKRLPTKLFMGNSANDSASSNIND